MAERRRGLSLGTRIFLVTGLLLVLALGVAIVVTSYLGNRIGLATATERRRTTTTPIPSATMPQAIALTAPPPAR